MLKITCLPPRPLQRTKYLVMCFYLRWYSRLRILLVNRIVFFVGDIFFGAVVPFRYPFLIYRFGSWQDGGLFLFEIPQGLSFRCLPQVFPNESIVLLILVVGTHAARDQLVIYLHEFEPLRQICPKSGQFGLLLLYLGVHFRG